VAAECPFRAYHTQLTEPEVVALIDLVQELTNGDDSGKNPGLIILDPFADVPDPFKDASPTMASQVWPFQNTSPPLQEKDPLAWQKELVEQTWETGLPQLLRCVSTLVTSIICALDGRNVARPNHSPAECVWEWQSALTSQHHVDGQSHCNSRSTLQGCRQELEASRHFGTAHDGVRHVAADGTVRLDVATIWSSLLEGGSR
jgi:hypothetical protein